METHTLDEVEKALHWFKNGKAPDDTTSAQCLKNGGRPLVITLHNLISRYGEQRKYHQVEKKAR